MFTFNLEIRNETVSLIVEYGDPTTEILCDEPGCGEYHPDWQAEVIFWDFPDHFMAGQFYCEMADTLERNNWEKYPEPHTAILETIE